jgi:dethiobiotin synthetase
MKNRNLYIAATDQHVGKTTTTLGLAAAFRDRGKKVGYSKPVGQMALEINMFKVDKDALLFADLLGFEIDPALHSPVIMDRGATVRYLDNQNAFDLESLIDQAARALEQQYDLVIHEGTGHPGVGAVGGVSNADAARIIGAPVILVAEGGIGNTLDRIVLCFPIFEEAGVPILGIVANKVWLNKKEKITDYLRAKLEQWNLPLLGVLPYDESLAFPLMESIVQAVKGITVANEQNLTNKVEEIIAGSLVEAKDFETHNHLLLVVSAQRTDEAVERVIALSKQLGLDRPPISGILATGSGLITGATVDYVRQHRIPLVRTSLDTFGSVVKISKIEVKINRSTPWKVKSAIELVKQHVDFNLIEKLMAKY